MDKTCWLCSDFSACWCGKINIEVGCFIVGTCVVPWSVMVGLGRLFAATVSTVPGHRARPLAAPRGAVLPAALPAVLPAVL